MNYSVHFIRKDTQPEEIYYYNTLVEAKYHLQLFYNDDSGLYQKIEVQNQKEEILESIVF